MNPFFFGETGHALYGVHHPPRGSVARGAGIILCYPFAQEYMRAHRAFRQLSLLLAGQGFHVLRFDYSGTGDSTGDHADMSLARWDADLGIAIEELMDTASVDSVWVVGLRLGGALALRAASRATVSGIVLWDPVVVGQEQLVEATPADGHAAGARLEIGGVPIVPALRDDLVELDLMKVSFPRGLEALLAVSSDDSRYRALRDRMTASGADVTYVCVPSDGRWSFFDNWGSALIPQGLIRAIVDYLTGAVR